MTRVLGINKTFKSYFGFIFAQSDMHVSSFLNKCKLGFTLAEVLITLGIIGVVAAMTIPTVINKYQKMVYKNQFKKMYSTIANAVNKADYDMGGSSCAYYKSSSEGSSSLVGTAATRQCPMFFENMVSNLKVAKKCIGKGLERGCITESYLSKYKDPSSLCGGFSKDSISNKNYIYILNDGSMIIPYSANNTPLLMIDTNGLKGPNVAGKDIFALELYKDDDNVIKFDADSIYHCINATQKERIFKSLYDILN